MLYNGVPCKGCTFITSRPRILEKARNTFCERVMGLPSVASSSCVAVCSGDLQRSVCCSALCVAVCCTVLQCVARSIFWRASREFAFCDFVFLRCSVLQRVAVCCSVLQHAATCCSVLQCFAHSTFCKQILGLSSYVAVCVEACCSILQCVAIYCSVLQCFARSTLCEQVMWLSSVASSSFVAVYLVIS